MNKFLKKSILILLILSGVLIETTTILRGNAKTVHDTQVVAETTLGEPPVAIILSPTNGTAIEDIATFRFDATTSSDPDGGTLEYLWEIDPMPERWGYPPGGDNPENRPFFNTRIQTPGNYTVTLTVTDEEGLTAQTFILIEIVQTAGQRATSTTAGETVTETTVETTTGDILTVRPNFLPGYSVLLVIFALFTPVVLKRKRNK